MTKQARASGLSAQAGSLVTAKSNSLRKTTAVAIIFLVASEPTFLTVSHGLFPLLLALLIAGAVLHRIPILRLSPSATLPIAFVAVAAASVGWSILPNESAVGAFALVILLIAALLVASKVEIPYLVSGVIAGAAASLIISLAIAIVRPDLGLVAESYKYGSLRGIYEHRNQMGYTMTIGVVALASSRNLWLRARRNTTIGMLLAFLGGIIWSASSSALAMTLVSLLFAAALRSIPKSQNKLRPFYLTCYLLIGIFGTWLVTNEFGEVTQLLGRDETLTGRTTIWPHVLEAWLHSPWFGFGWEAVWLDGSYVADWVSRQVDGYRVYHAHNSYLDVLIQLGIMGLLVFGGCLILALGKGVRWVVHMLQKRGTVEWMFPSLLLATLAFYSIVETRISHPLGLFILFYIASHQEHADRSGRLVKGVIGNSSSALRIGRK